MISNCKNFKANVYVGKQQYDRYVDHPICNKSIYIYNMYPTQNINSSHVSKENNVVYIGSLVESKGFHLLAYEWKKILKKVKQTSIKLFFSLRIKNAYINFNDGMLEGPLSAKNLIVNNFFRSYLNEGKCKEEYSTLNLSLS